MHGKCDLCAALAAHRVPISIDGSKPKTLDLCELHQEKLLQPVLDALDRYGMFPQKGAKADRPVDTNSRPYWLRKLGPFKCRMPGCVAPVLKNGEVFERHLRRLHDTTFMAYAKDHGDDTATAEEIAEPVTVECTVKGCDSGPDGGPMVYSTLYGNRWPHHAMTSHMRGRHGLVWKPGTGVVGKVG